MQISKLHAEGKVDGMLYALARGPDRRFLVSNRCSINGFFFRSRQVEKNLTTQNSGIVVEGADGMEWYGVLKRTITLEFPNAKEVLLFECDWYDVPAPTRNKSRGYSKDIYGIVDIDTTLKMNHTSWRHKLSKCVMCQVQRKLIGAVSSD